MCPDSFRSNEIRVIFFSSALYRNLVLQVIAKALVERHSTVSRFSLQEHSSLAFDPSLGPVIVINSLPFLLSTKSPPILFCFILLVCSYTVICVLDRNLHIFIIFIMFILGKGNWFKWNKFLSNTYQMNIDPLSLSAFSPAPTSLENFPHT